MRISTTGHEPAGDKGLGMFDLSLDTEIAWGNCWHGAVQRYAAHYNAYRGLIRRLVRLPE